MEITVATANLAVFGGLGEDSTRMVSVPGGEGRVTELFSEARHSQESQSFSSLINTSASALGRSLTRTHSLVSIWQQQMGWGGENEQWRAQATSACPRWVCRSSSRPHGPSGEIQRSTLIYYLSIRLSVSVLLYWCRFSWREQSF